MKGIEVIMKEKVTFYRCEECGNVTAVLNGEKKDLLCCGKKMKALISNSTDVATEKHVPVYKKVDDEIIVKVGEIEHPMETDHYIMWIALVSDGKTTKEILKPGQPAEARFQYISGSIIYAYCNKHGLWKKMVE